MPDGQTPEHLKKMSGINTQPTANRSKWINFALKRSFAEILARLKIRSDRTGGKTASGSAVTQRREILRRKILLYCASIYARNDLKSIF